jgi:hypothetical protein
MKRFTCLVPLVSSVLAVLGLAGPGVAQQAARQEMVPFKVTMSYDTRSFVIPGVPPLLSLEASAPGEAEPLGKFTLFLHYVIQVDTDGVPLFGAGDRAWMGANGDAFFSRGIVIRHPPAAATPHILPFEGAQVITGGTGRFAGATGSGFYYGEFDAQTGKVITVTYEFMISAPKQ